MKVVKSIVVDVERVVVAGQKRLFHGGRKKGQRKEGQQRNQDVKRRDETKLAEGTSAARHGETTLEDERHVERCESGLWHNSDEGEGGVDGGKKSGLYVEEEGEDRAVLLRSGCRGTDKVRCYCDSVGSDEGEGDDSARGMTTDLLENENKRRWTRYRRVLGVVGLEAVVDGVEFNFVRRRDKLAILPSPVVRRTGQQRVQSQLGDREEDEYGDGCDGCDDERRRGGDEESREQASERASEDCVVLGWENG